MIPFSICVEITGAALADSAGGACLLNWSIVSVILNTPPPRDPSDDDDEDEDDEDDEDRDNEPAVIREPDDNE